MARTAKNDIESRWYDIWSGWSKEDRAIAMRVLQGLHPRLPDKPTKKTDPVPPEVPGAAGKPKTEQPELPGAGGAFGVMPGGRV